MRQGSVDKEEQGCGGMPERASDWPGGNRGMRPPTSHCSVRRGFRWLPRLLTLFLPNNSGSERFSVSECCRIAIIDIKLVIFIRIVRYCDNRKGQILCHADKGNDWTTNEGMVFGVGGVFAEI